MGRQNRSEITIATLLDAVAERLITTDESLIRIPEVCEATGVNYGSVYHHFRNRDAVIDAAYAKIFTQYVDQDIEMLRVAAELPQDAGTFLEIIRGVIRLVSDSPSRHNSRQMRLRVVAVAQTRPQLYLQISEAQARLTDKLAEVVAIAQERGFVNIAISAKSIAVAIQSLLFGRALDKASSSPLSDEAWVEMSDAMLIALLLPAENRAA